MTFKSFVAGLTLAGSLAIGELPAQEVQYKTMEMRGGASSQEPAYVTVATHRHVRRRYARRPRYVVKRRSRKKSAAIVGGSAAAGAAIGALAGGGKGAAIGAIAGGGAGYIYDRKTHKKVYRRE